MINPVLHHILSIMGETNNRILPVGIQSFEKIREEGLAKGMEKEKISTARRLLSMGLSEEQVSTATELSLEEIQNLRK